MNTKKLFATVAISAMLLTGCSFNKKDVIVKVNDQEITQAQFDQTFDKAMGSTMLGQLGANARQDKKGFLYLMLKDKVVSELIVRSLLDQEMEKRHIKATKADSDKELKSIIDKIGSKEKFNEALKQNGISTAQFKKDLKEEVKIKKLLSIISSVKITDADASKFYKKNIDKFKYPDKVRASHILIAANPEEIKEKLMAEPLNKSLSKEEIQAKVNKEIAIKKEKAQSILAQLKRNPADFEKIARSVSEDPGSAKKGGDLGFFAKNEMVEPFSKVAFEQKPNTISDLVQSPYGYHIILVKDRMKAGLEPYAKVKDEIITYLDNKENGKVLDNLLESLKKQAKIEYVNPEFKPTSLQEELAKQVKGAGKTDKATKK